MVHPWIYSLYLPLNLPLDLLPVSPLNLPLDLLPVSPLDLPRDPPLDPALDPALDPPWTHPYTHTWTHTWTHPWIYSVGPGHFPEPTGPMYTWTHPWIPLDLLLVVPPLGTPLGPWVPPVQTQFASPCAWVRTPGLVKPIGQSVHFGLMVQSWEAHTYEYKRLLYSRDCFTIPQTLL